VHDTVEFERRGYPAVLVATENFVEEALQQAKLLGMSGLRMAIIPHPLATRPAVEVITLGHQVGADALSLVTSADGGEKTGPA
jgi:hypothetical protein